MGKNQQIVSLKVMTFRLQYITMYFADINLPLKESVTQAFAFSGFIKQTPKTSWLPCNWMQITDET